MVEILIILVIISIILCVICLSLLMKNTINTKWVKARLEAYRTYYDGMHEANKEYYDGIYQNSIDYYNDKFKELYDLVLELNKNTNLQLSLIKAQQYETQ